AGADPTKGESYGKHSFLSIILPYLEQGNVLAQGGIPYKYHLDWYDLPNRPASSSRIPTYESPSSQFSSHLFDMSILNATDQGTYGNPLWQPRTTDYYATTRAN